MRLPNERLTFLALCALYEATTETRRAPVRPTSGLRLALAWLYHLSEGDRAVFESFWTTIQQSDGEAAWAADGRLRRGVEARQLMRLIFRLVGMEGMESRIETMRRG